ncbi:40S ribosomal protein s10-like protein [Metarhizium guizhouense ARSEF 977]|uniref:40S ribosomal protein s10-like protein n=1 Tax=Metarhizium guizhouense (strain ARSEF 977) TaxID=1276136 RepID=A0A0B4I7A9_METGA|nr:40S ribosomal protein s10-like protein [Metarhizium guizhouense ARSEF 977]
MADSIIELAFVTNMVSWLHGTASATFSITSNGTIFDLIGVPRNLLVDQGHSSNGAAGTAFVIVGLGGVLALWLQGRSMHRGQKLSNLIYRTWLLFTVLATVFTLATLAYVFAVTNSHKGQVIDVDLAATLVDTRYPRDKWTPQGWFGAVLRLDLASAGERRDAIQHLRIMHGWQYNLIPMFLLQLILTVLAVVDATEVRKWRKVESVEDYK